MIYFVRQVITNTFIAQLIIRFVQKINLITCS